MPWFDFLSKVGSAIGTLAAIAVAAWTIYSGIIHLKKSFGPELPSPRRALLAVLRARWVIVACTFAGVITTAILLERLPAIYRTSSLVWVQADSTHDSFTLSDRIGLIESYGMAERVVHRMISAKPYRQRSVALDSARVSAHHRTKLTSLIHQGVAAEIARPGSRTIRIVAESSNPRFAATVANTYATQAVIDGQGTVSGVTLPATVIRILDPAQVPSVPARASESQLLFASFIVAFFLSVLAVLMRHVSDSRIRGPEDLRDFDGKLLGAIPHMKSGASILSHGDAAAEAFRFLWTSFLIGPHPARDTRVILVTSALPGDGKSTVASNLAVTAARYGLKVALVDADMRRGSLHDRFGYPSEPGLSHYLFGLETLEGIMHHSDPFLTSSRLTVIPRGMLPPICSELLIAKSMVRCVEQLRHEYDLVVIDSPPANIVTDAALLALYSDQIIFVVREFKTTRAALSYGCRVLQAEIPIGFVLNGVKLPRWVSNFVGSYGYGYYVASDREEVKK